ncbi:hypothetical protein M3Y95_00358200 [Aphelenchoides besseyi]|nr:hypothetical protein M3Y95_00358200 [Aphelenchoides besseyi]
MDAEATSRNESNCVGEIESSLELSPHTIDGRFLFSSTNHELQIIDIFHSKRRCFKYQYSTNVVVDGHPQNLTDELEVLDFYIISTATIIMAIGSYTWSIQSRPVFLGVGQIDYESSVVLVKHVLTIDIHITYGSWLPLTFPPNLNDGVLCRACVSPHNQITYILLRFGDDGKLRRTDFVDMSADTNVFACIDGYFYGLMEQRSEGKLIGIDLIRTNPLTNEQFQQPTSNWEVMDDITEGHLTVTYETEPEKLSTLVWLRLKRIFDAHPSAYEFICGKIPATFKLKHTPL